MTDRPSDSFSIDVLRTSTAEQAASGVRRLILNGEIAPGDPLVESHLADFAGVSRNTMREAIRLLALEGLVERRSNRVALVRRFTRKEQRDRPASRSGSCEEQPPSTASVAADADARAALMRAADEVAGASARADWQHIADADLQFHQCLIGLSADPGWSPPPATRGRGSASASPCTMRQRGRARRGSRPSTNVIDQPCEGAPKKNAIFDRDEEHLAAVMAAEECP